MHIGFRQKGHSENSKFVICSVNPKQYPDTL
jgi:hypothetical protein